VIVDAVKTGGESPDSLLSDAGSLWRLHVPAVAPEVFLAALAADPHPADSEPDPVRKSSLIHAFPQFLVREWMSAYGDRQAESLCATLNEEAPVVLRVNTLRASAARCREALAAEGVAAVPTRWSPDGLILPKRVNVRTLRSYLDGMFELQDEGSQLIGYLAGPSPGRRVVDACAGGGGKTLHCAALMKGEGEILAIDNDPHRLGHLQARMDRAGVSIVRTAIAGRDDAVIAGWHQQADIVLVDAPCTGCGTLRRNPGLKLRLDEAEVITMARTQRSILAEYAPLVRPGGRLVYSTCSLHRAENEDVVSGFLRSAPEFRQEDAVALLQRNGISLDGVTPPAITLLPHLHGTDGFFLASLVRG
jgi:16S rRNA (cytosine967-C5)-methyltransferase